MAGKTSAALPRTTPGTPWERSEPHHPRDVHDELTLLVRGRQVDGRGDPPVVVALRVADDLLDLPSLGPLPHDQQAGPGGVGAGVDRAVVGEVRLEGAPPVLPGHR